MKQFNIPSHIFIEGDIITSNENLLDNKGEVTKATTNRIIGVFDSLAWHGGSKEFFHSSFADFSESIVARTNGELIYNLEPNGDDDTYCPGDDLHHSYRHATAEERERYKNKMNEYKASHNK